MASVTSAPAYTNELRNPPSPTSPIWQAALEKYYAELRKGGIKLSVIDKDLWNTHGPDDLLAQIGTQAPSEAQAFRAWTRDLDQLKPILERLSDFTAMIALAMGMNSKVATVIWGSIRLIITVMTFTLICSADCIIVIF